MMRGRVLLRVFAGDEARPLSPVLGEGGPLGVAEWQAEELEPPLKRPAVAHFLPELRPRLADPRREEAPWKRLLSMRATWPTHCRVRRPT